MEDRLVATGLDDAIIGIGRRCSKPDITVYSIEKVIKILMDRDGMDFHEAEEFFEHNIVGAWVGEGTPIFVFPCDQ
jgi:hypothetical protein